ncbi:MAG TPA: DAK2 domain-containing protein [Candidatus Saccharimonadales bacterium]|nr:DAK2 domain-containing protein [Candidatus Saccharimonadales bacterium]
MNGSHLGRLLDAALERLAASAEELRDLDAALGDGDLGITIAGGTAAARTAIAGLPSDATPHDVLLAIAPAVARANPSTFGTLTAFALMAGARSIPDAADLTREDVVRVGRAAIEAIATRGKSAVGDKTVLDALVPSVDAIDGCEAESAAASGGATLAALDLAIEAARRGVDETKGLTSRRGRAAWIGDRGQGTPDAGATAYLRFLEGLRAAIAAGD